MIPLWALSLALTAGGSVAHGLAEREAAKARSAALEAERIRQQAFEQRQTAISQQSQGEMEQFQPDMDERQDQLVDMFTVPTADAEANEDSGMVAPEGASSITVREMANQAGRVDERAAENAQNMASMRAFGDLLGDRMRGIGRGSAEIDQLTGFRRGSQDASAFEVDAAMQQGAGKRLLGDILKGGGAVLGGFSNMSGAANPVVTNMADRFLPGGDRLAAALRGAGVPGVQSFRGRLG